RGRTVAARAVREFPRTNARPAQGPRSASGAPAPPRGCAPGRAQVTRIGARAAAPHSIAQPSRYVRVTKAFAGAWSNCSAAESHRRVVPGNRPATTPTSTVSLSGPAYENGVDVVPSPRHASVHSQ